MNDVEVYTFLSWMVELRNHYQQKEYNVLGVMGVRSS